MSKKNEKNYTVEEILEEYGKSDGDNSNEAAAAEEEITADTTTPGDEDAADASDAEGGGELEEDDSEALNADISLAGESEWETPENIATDGVFDGSDKAEEDVTETDGDNSTEDVTEKDVEEASQAAEENEISQTSEADEAEQEEQTEQAAQEEDVNQSFVKRLLKAVLPWKGDSVFEVIRKIIFIIAVTVFIGAGVMLVSTLIQSRRAVMDSKTDESVFESIMNGGETTVVTTIDEHGSVMTVTQTKPENAEIDLAAYYKERAEDYVGFLELKGCDIRQPVVQGEDNDYYLTHTYYGGTNKAGALFMDHRCTFTEDYVSPNIVIYGHNQEDGTMFGNLKRYKQNVEFYQENPVVTLMSEKETGEYLIYGFFVTNALERQDSNGEVFHYHDYIETLNDENTFNWYLKEVYERNQIVSPVDVKFGDKLLCLSTCSNEFSNSRFVVFARKLREGETAADYDFSKTYLNPNARGVDWVAIMSGETTTTEATTESFDIIIEIMDDETTVETEETEETTKKKKKKKKTTTAATTTTEETTVPSEESSDSSDSSDTSETASTGYTGYTGPTGPTDSTGSTETQGSSSAAESGTETAPPESADDTGSETVTAS